jgi:hypothetical protein
VDGIATVSALTGKQAFSPMTSTPSGASITGSLVFQPVSLNNHRQIHQLFSLAPQKPGELPCLSGRATGACNPCLERVINPMFDCTMPRKNMQENFIPIWSTFLFHQITPSSDSWLKTPHNDAALFKPDSALLKKRPKYHSSTAQFRLQSTIDCLIIRLQMPTVNAN